MKFTLKALFLIFPLFLVAQQGNKNLISKRFKDQDSLKIKIIYKEINGCLGHGVGKISLQAKKEKFGLVHFTSSETMKSEHFRGLNNNIINYFIEFEQQAKEQIPLCSGINDDHCFEVQLSINGLSTEFIFKANDTPEWYGIVELIDKLRALKTN